MWKFLVIKKKLNYLILIGDEYFKLYFLYKLENAKLCISSQWAIADFDILPCDPKSIWFLF